LSHLKYPIVGDPVYGGRFAQPKGAGQSLVDTLRGFKRQALHAASLGFDHPRTGKRQAFSSPVPGDFAALLLALRNDAAAAAADLERRR
jgi:23S rRNA pseudouridine1911/1915/1917 synthase